MSCRPQVGIERLPASPISNEPRESMNCKSCRKRKIKCNRLRPTCEACQVFQCPCIYDAIPKKRGPKTDVLEALLKRVDGLEQRLKYENKAHSPNANTSPVNATRNEAVSRNTKLKRPRSRSISAENESAVYSPVSQPSPGVSPNVLLDTYFTKCHGKTYHILDELTTRERIQFNRLPSYLLYAIYAVSARYATHPSGYHASVRLSEEYTQRARRELDIDDPSIDCLQAFLLLSEAFTAAGKGKKAYMMLSNGIGMALALELHQECSPKIRMSPVEKEMRRRLFWTCYLMDRFAACGSRRPSTIADESIILRLPSWFPNPATLSVEGEFFQNGSNLRYHSGSGKRGQGSTGLLIDMGRILGITNRYLDAGGVKGDSHFPWHSLSNLSKIQQDLDIWASGTQDVFSSVDTLFGQPDSTTLVLSKLIYHLIHCLIYRPFLPVDLTELAGTGQHQSWQTEATNLCFLHANAIAELVELGRQSSSIEWPAFVGYCICTAGTVHVHGSHYKGGPEEVFSASADFLSREMQQLSELRYAWSSVQHQRETLQSIYGCHSELVKPSSRNSLRYSPVSQLEDFFDRYGALGQVFDGAHISFSDILTNPTQDRYTGHDIYASRTVQQNEEIPSVAKRRKSSSSRKKQHGHRNGHSDDNTMLSPNSALGNDPPPTEANVEMRSESLIEPTPLAQFTTDEIGIPNLSQTPFSPPYASYPSLQSSEHYDPTFGIPGLSSSIPDTVHGGIGGISSPGIDSNGGFEYTLDAQLVGEGSGMGSESKEKDPFLSLLEQLADNEHSRGGPSELDFFLSGGAST